MYTGPKSFISWPACIKAPISAQPSAVVLCAKLLPLILCQLVNTIFLRAACMRGISVLIINCYWLNWSVCKIHSAPGETQWAEETVWWTPLVTWLPPLTHWGRVTHICVSKLTIIGSDNGLLPDRRQAIIWTNAGLLLIGPLGTNFSEILIEILTFSFKKMRLKVSSAKRRPFCLGLNVLHTLNQISESWILPTPNTPITRLTDYGGESGYKITHISYSKFLQPLSYCSLVLSHSKCFPKWLKRSCEIQQHFHG